MNFDLISFLIIFFFRLPAQDFPNKLRELQQAVKLSKNFRFLSNFPFESSENDIYGRLICLVSFTDCSHLNQVSFDVPGINFPIQISQTNYTTLLVHLVRGKLVINFSWISHFLWLIFVNISFLDLILPLKVILVFHLRVLIIFCDFFVKIVKILGL